MEYNLPQQKISIEQLPAIIGNTFKHISEVDRKISNAVSRAEEAKKLADEASQKMQDGHFLVVTRKKRLRHYSQLQYHKQMLYLIRWMPIRNYLTTRKGCPKPFAICLD